MPTKVYEYTRMRKLAGGEMKEYLIREEYEPKRIPLTQEQKTEIDRLMKDKVPKKYIAERIGVSLYIMNKYLAENPM